MSSTLDTQIKTKVKNKRKIKCKYFGCKKYFEAQNDSNLCCEEHHNLIRKYEKPEECPICLTLFESELTDEKKNKNIFIPLIPCHHWVCTSCVINSGKSECPICRQPVNLTTREEQKCNRKALLIKKEKDRIQLEEDRRLAEQMQREMNQQENRGRNVIQVVIPMREIPQVALNNIDEMMQIINALTDPVERQIFRQLILGQNRVNNIIENDDEDDVEDDIEDDLE